MQAVHEQDCHHALGNVCFAGHRYTDMQDSVIRKMKEQLNTATDKARIRLKVCACVGGCLCVCESYLHT